MIANFVPVLTVIVDHGNAPFLWRICTPDQCGIGPNLCDGSYWDDSFPMSEGLWRKFADWAIEFNKHNFDTTPFSAGDWDWLTFHARGLQLARRLKEEVGVAYRVMYDKPVEDPNQNINERTEILDDGTLLPQPHYHSPFSKPPRLCKHIVSGGQTGADRGALDFAMNHGLTHGGWAPHGRLAEDGVIPLKYQLAELSSGGYRQRTRRNVADSDATLIINFGELTGGTLATQVIAERFGKPFLVVPVDSGISQVGVEDIIVWLRANNVQTLNVAGPRESKRPGIYQLTVEVLKAVDTRFQMTHPLYRI